MADPKQVSIYLEPEEKLAIQMVAEEMHARFAPTIRHLVLLGLEVERRRLHPDRLDELIDEVAHPRPTPPPAPQRSPWAVEPAHASRPSTQAERARQDAAQAQLEAAAYPEGSDGFPPRLQGVVSEIPLPQTPEVPHSEPGSRHDDLMGLADVVRPDRQRPAGARTGEDPFGEYPE